MTDHHFEILTRMKTKRSRPLALERKKNSVMLQEHGRVRYDLERPRAVLSRKLVPQIVNGIVTPIGFAVAVRGCFGDNT